jgi:hypothetical protein
MRTIAQQLILFQQAQANRCGITIAAEPGKSNHQSGLALDIEDHAGLATFPRSSGLEVARSIGIRFILTLKVLGFVTSAQLLSWRSSNCGIKTIPMTGLQRMGSGSEFHRSSAVNLLLMALLMVRLSDTGVNGGGSVELGDRLLQLSAHFWKEMTCAKFSKR